MKRGYRLLRDCVFHNPYGLSSFNDNMKRIASAYLPVSVGIEVECSKLRYEDATVEEILRNYDDLNNDVNKLRYHHLLDVSLSDMEQRFRLKPGIEGMIGLYNVSEFLKKYFGLNNLSGIHYHIDCTEDWELVKKLPFNLRASEKALKKLDSWNYQGKYNKRRVIASKSSWIAVRSAFKTCEIRIGEMTFDYNLLMKRIVHGCSIIKSAIKDLKSTF